MSLSAWTLLVSAFTALLATTSVSTGPVRLLSCEVSPTGLLEAEVSNTSDFEQTCQLRCDYVIRDALVAHRSEVAVPARWRGRVGQYDTSSGRPGTYTGELDGCQVTLGPRGDRT